MAAAHPFGAFVRCRFKRIGYVRRIKVNTVHCLFQVENSLSTYEPHACVVVYSIVDRATFKTVEDILNYLWRENYTQDKSVILVGNKADLARSRVIPTNGKNCISLFYII